MATKKTAPAPEINATAASLLGFLLHGPATGWDLAHDIDGSVGYFWNVTRSQIYKELKALAAAGLISQGKAGPRDRQPFSISAEGRAAFKAWIARPPAGETMRMPFVLTVFFGDSVEPALLRRYSEDARRAYESRLAEYLEIEPHVANPYQRQALECGIRYTRMMLAWIDDLPWLARGEFPKVPAHARPPHASERAPKTRKRGR